MLYDLEHATKLIAASVQDQQFANSDVCARHIDRQ
jgi:hypothetical protein